MVHKCKMLWIEKTYVTKCSWIYYVLNIFLIVSQACEKINFINKSCLKTPLVDNILPYLFYTYGKIIEHNKNIFEKKFSETFTYFTQYIHFDTHPSHFKLPTIPN